MNTFSDIFKKSFLEGFHSGDIGISRILVTLAVTTAIAAYIFIVYYVATKKTFYNKSYYGIHYLGNAVQSGNFLGYGGCAFHCPFPYGD